jgi:DNA-binding transcriptional ArsR family regulator
MDSPYPTDQNKNAENASKYLKVLSNKNRLLVMCSIVRKPKTVGDLVKITKLSQPALSLHLAELRRNKMLDSKKIGKQVFYTISSNRLRDLVEHLCYKFECW